MKKCFVCLLDKDLSEFTKLARSKDGYNSNCKECKNKRQRERHNKKETSEVNISNKICCVCKLNKPSCEFNAHKSMKDGLRSQCRNCQSNYRKDYHSFEENKKRSSEQNKKFCNKYKHERNKQKRNKYKQDIQFKIRHNLGCKLSNILNSPDQKFHNFIGCTTAFFKKWIEFQFDNTMNWSNYGFTTELTKKWEFDHILGYNNFDLTDAHERMLCTHWTNIQPMWGIDNKVKSEHIELYHFMNSIINVHRFIQHTQTYKDGYKYIKNRLNWLKTKIK